MKNYISIFVLSLILVSSNISHAQYGNSMPQNLINAPGVFNFNTANSITGNQTRQEYDYDADGTADQIFTLKPVINCYTDNCRFFYATWYRFRYRFTDKSQKNPNYFSYSTPPYPLKISVSYPKPLLRMVL